MGLGPWESGSRVRFLAAFRAWQVGVSTVPAHRAAPEMTRCGNDQLPRGWEAGGAERSRNRGARSPAGRTTAAAKAASGPQGAAEPRSGRNLGNFPWGIRSRSQLTSACELVQGCACVVSSALWLPRAWELKRSADPGKGGRPPPPTPQTPEERASQSARSEGAWRSQTLGARSIPSRLPLTGTQQKAVQEPPSFPFPQALGSAVSAGHSPGLQGTSQLQACVTL